MTDIGRDLRSCNNKLVSFIEKARVLAEALDIKSSLPGHLAEKTTVEVQVEEMEALFRQEIEALSERVRDTRKTHKSRAAFRSELETENRRVRAEIEANLQQLRSDQNKLNTLDLTLNDLSGKTSNLEYLRNQIEVRCLSSPWSDETLIEGSGGKDPPGQVESEQRFLERL